MKLFRGLILGIPIGLCLWLILLYPLWAQEQPSPKVRALNERIGIEINNNLVCAENVQTLLDRIKQLESEAKKAPEPKE